MKKEDQTTSNIEAFPDSQELLRRRITKELRSTMVQLGIVGDKLEPLIAELADYEVAVYLDPVYRFNFGFTDPLNESQSEQLHEGMQRFVDDHYRKAVQQLDEAKAIIYRLVNEKYGV